MMAKTGTESHEHSQSFYGSFSSFKMALLRSNIHTKNACLLTMIVGGALIGAKRYNLFTELDIQRCVGVSHFSEHFAFPT